MKVIKKVVKTSLVLAMLGTTSVFAQNITEAKKAIDAEQYQKAKSSLKSLAASQPTAEVYFHLGNLYLSDYPDSAKAAFNKGIATDSKNSLNYIGLGALDLAGSNSSAAKANFDKAIAQAARKDNDPYIYVAKAYISAPKPDYAAAISHLEKAIAMDAKDAEAYLALGDAYRGQEKISEAFSAYRSAYDLNKNLLRAKIELGVINKRAQAWQESLDEFNKVLAINPNYAPAYREIAETYNRWAQKATDIKDWEARNQQALTSYIKYMDMTDRSLESRMRYADFLILAKDYKTLEREAQEMAKLDETNPRIYRYLGYSAFENGNTQAAVQSINDFIAKAGADRAIPLDYVYLAKAQLKSGDITNAVNNLKKASELDINKTTPVEGLSVIAKDLYTAKKYDLAAQVYDFTQSAPNAATIDYYWQGNSYYYDYQSKDLAKANPSKDLLVKADSSYSRFLQRSPTTESVWLMKAKVNQKYDTNDQKALARDPYLKYIELVTAKPELVEKNKANLIDAYYYLGFTSVKSDPNKAREYFNKVLQLDPTHANAQQALKSLASK
jgi:tetratricopeptide (TPR) repeat protein